MDGQDKVTEAGAIPTEIEFLAHSIMETKAQFRAEAKAQSRNKEHELDEGLSRDGERIFDPHPELIHLGLLGW